MQETRTFVRKASIHVILENVEMLNFPLNILYLYFCFVLHSHFYFSSKKGLLDVLQEQSVLEFCTTPMESIFIDLHSSITPVVSRRIIIKSEIRCRCGNYNFNITFFTIIGKNSKRYLF